MKLGGTNEQSLKQAAEAKASAESLRPLIEQLAGEGMSMTAIAAELNRRQDVRAGGPVRAMAQPNGQAPGRAARDQLSNVDRAYISRRRGDCSSGCSMAEDVSAASF